MRPLIVDAVGSFFICENRAPVLLLQLPGMFNLQSRKHPNNIFRSNFWIKKYCLDVCKHPNNTYSSKNWIKKYCLDVFSIPKLESHKQSGKARTWQLRKGLTLSIRGHKQLSVRFLLPAVLSTDRLLRKNGIVPMYAKLFSDIAAHVLAIKSPSTSHCLASLHPNRAPCF